MRKELRELISLPGGQGDSPGASACPAALPSGIDGGPAEVHHEAARARPWSSPCSPCRSSTTWCLKNNEYVDAHHLRGLHAPHLLHGPGGRQEPGQLLRRPAPRGRTRTARSSASSRPASTSSTSPSTSSRGRYVKFRFLKKVGWKGFVDGPDSGVYSVAPLARLNVADGMATPAGPGGVREVLRDAWAASRCTTRWPTTGRGSSRCSMPPSASSNWPSDPEITDPNVRTIPTATPREGIGVVEAPRGTLFHHYETDERGVITKANLIVATQNNAARIAHVAWTRPPRRSSTAAKVNDGVC